MVDPVDGGSGFYPRTREAFTALIEVEVWTRQLLGSAERFATQLSSWDEDAELWYQPPPDEDDDADIKEMIAARRKEKPKEFDHVWRAADSWYNIERKLRKVIENAKMVADRAGAELDAASTPPLQRTSIAIKRALRNLSGSVPYARTSGWAEGVQPHVLQAIAAALRPLYDWTDELRLLVQPEHTMLPPRGLDPTAPYERGNQVEVLAKPTNSEPTTEGNRFAQPGSQPDVPDAPAPDPSDAAAAGDHPGAEAPTTTAELRAPEHPHERANQYSGDTGITSPQRPRRAELRRAAAESNDWSTLAGLLKPYQREILRFMNTKGATSPDNVRTKRDIALKLYNRDTHAKSLGNICRELVILDLLGSQYGAVGGGYWITTHGQTVCRIMDDPANGNVEPDDEESVP